MTELLPCPCCGGAPNVEQQMTRTYSIDCQDCGIQTDWLSLDRAVSTWNTRPAPAGLTGEQIIGLVQHTKQSRPSNLVAMVDDHRAPGTTYPDRCSPPDWTES